MLAPPPAQTAPPSRKLAGRLPTFPAAAAAFTSSPVYTRSPSYWVGIVGQRTASTTTAESHIARRAAVHSVASGSCVWTRITTGASARDQVNISWNAGLLRARNRVAVP